MLEWKAMAPTERYDTGVYEVLGRLGRSRLGRSRLWALSFMN